MPTKYGKEVDIFFNKFNIKTEKLKKEHEIKMIKAEAKIKIQIDTFETELTRDEAKQLYIQLAIELGLQDNSEPVQRIYPICQVTHIPQEYTITCCKHD